MIPAAFSTFIDRLRPETENNKIIWKEGGQWSYFCIHKNYKLYISRHFNVDHEVASFNFRVDVDGRSTPFTVWDYEAQDYREMDQLFQAIIANANTVQDDLDQFFD